MGFNVSTINPTKRCFGDSFEDVDHQKKIAATTIQRVWRGYLIRSREETTARHLLSYTLLEQAKHYINTPSKLASLPQAPSGTTPIYLPKEFPIVLKKSGSPDNRKRFIHMKQGREICQRSNYKYLIIPRARVYANFIIERRLPIKAWNTKEQIGLYIENREQFTRAIQEFVGFICQSDLSGITGGNLDPYGTLSRTPIGRYDNVVLYLEKNEGRIGLLDLKQFSPECNKEQEDWCFFKCQEAIDLFPCHLDEILSAAKNFDPTIDIYREVLMEEREKALKRFRIAYEDHLNFIKLNKITFDHPTEISTIKISQQKYVEEEIALFLQQKHEDIQYKDCLGANPENTLQLFNEAFPPILDLVTTFLLSLLKEKYEAHPRAISSYGQLLSLRTLRFTQNSSHYQDLIKQVSTKLNMLKIAESDQQSFALLLTKEMFRELAKGQAIAYYNPRFGYGKYATHCVFC